MGDPGQVPGGAEGSESQIAPRHDGTAHDTMLEENTLLRNTQHTSTFESATAPIDGDVSVDTLPNPPPQSIEIMQLLNELHTGIQSANRTALSADPYLAELLLGSGTSFENAIAIIGAVPTAGATIAVGGAGAANAGAANMVVGAGTTIATGTFAANATGAGAVIGA